MDFIADVSKANIGQYLREYEVILCALRNSRIRAKQTAILEIMLLQHDNNIRCIQNGPLGDIRGLISFFCPKTHLASFGQRLRFAGYCDVFYLLDFDDVHSGQTAALHSINPMVWKGRKFSVRQLFSQDNAVYRAQSPHNREFKIADDTGEVKCVKGYRGNGSERGRRALPVEDARCMVNLSQPYQRTKMLDPFAGAGGIIVQFNYIAPGGMMTSVDIDPALAPGLASYSTVHYAMDAGDVSFADHLFDSVITEVPFSIDAEADIVKALNNIHDSLAENGVYVIMCAEHQTGFICDTMEALHTVLFWNQKIDRKGMDVEIQVWHKNGSLMDEMRYFVTILKKIH